MSKKLEPTTAALLGDAVATYLTTFPVVDKERHDANMYELFTLLLRRLPAAAIPVSMLVAIIEHIPVDDDDYVAITAEACEAFAKPELACQIDRSFILQRLSATSHPDQAVLHQRWLNVLYFMGLGLPYPDVLAWFRATSDEEIRSRLLDAISSSLYFGTHPGGDANSEFEYWQQRLGADGKAATLALLREIASQSNTNNDYHNIISMWRDVGELGEVRHFLTHPHEYARDMAFRLLLPSTGKSPILTFDDVLAFYRCRENNAYHRRLAHQYLRDQYPERPFEEITNA